MVNKIPVDELYYANVVTKDAEATARNYAQFYGITKWKVVHHTADRISNTTVHGRLRAEMAPGGVTGDVPLPGSYTFTTATGTTENGGLTFRLVQPTSGLSTFEEFLVTRGPGVHSVFMSVVDKDEFTALKDWLKTENIRVGQSYTLDDAADFYFFDTRAVLGGFYIQVVVPRVADWEEAIAADEEWDFTGEVSRPGDVEATTQATAITHFGVIVHDVVKHVENFARLFDQPVWRGMNWRTEPGWLEDTTTNGKPVTHAYFTGRADVGKNKLGAPFGFEIVQPTFGPSHYKEDFLQVLGPGIHHMDLTMPMQDWSEWDAINNWLDELESPTCMSGWLRNHAALFHYQNTQKLLGYVIEIHPPPVPDRPPGRWAPDYWYDFSAVVPD
jgi:hypothetical protein